MEYISSAYMYFYFKKILYQPAKTQISLCNGEVSVTHCSTGSSAINKDFCYSYSLSQKQ